MRIRVIGSVLAASVVATTVAARSLDIVDVTQEPHHHVVMTNDWVRVLDVIVPAHTSTLMHRHVDDYLFVTLEGGAAQISNQRWGDPPAELDLHVGDVNFAAGLFAHLATVNSDGPFHNTTIALRQPATNVQRCDSGCVWRADQWVVTRATIPPGGTIDIHATATQPALLVGVSSVALSRPGAAGGASVVRGGPGAFAWMGGGAGGGLSGGPVANAGSSPAQIVVLAFKPAA